MPPDLPASESNFELAITPRTLAIIALIALDVLIVGPGGWLLKTLVDNYHDELTETHAQLDQLQQKIERLSDRIDRNTNAISGLTANAEQFHERMKDFQERLNIINSHNDAK